MSNKFGNKWIKPALPYLVLAVLIIGAWIVLNEIGAIWEFLGNVWSIIRPFFYGFLLAYILDMPRNVIERFLTWIRFDKIRFRSEKRRRVRKNKDGEEIPHVNFMHRRKRGISIALTYILFVAAFGAAISIAIPHIVDTTRSLIDNIIVVVEEDSIQPVVHDTLEEFTASVENIFNPPLPPADQLRPSVTTAISELALRIDGVFAYIPSEHTQAAVTGEINEALALLTQDIHHIFAYYRMEQLEQLQTAVLLSVSNFNETVEQIFDALPEGQLQPAVFSFVENLIDDVNNFTSFLPFQPIDVTWITDMLTDMGTSILDNIGLGTFMQPLNAVTGALFNSFLTFVSSIFVLIEKDRIKRFVCRLLLVLTSFAAYQGLIKYSTRLNNNFKKYIAVQTIDGLILGSLVTFILGVVIGSPYFLVLGLVLAVFNYVPYLGSIIATGIAVIVVMLTQGMQTGLLALLLLLITQQLDGNVIQPKLMGGSFKVSPLLVIISVIIGNAIAGILGMLIAIPVLALLKDILENYVAFREKKKGIFLTPEGEILHLTPEEPNDHYLDQSSEPDVDAAELASKTKSDLSEGADGLFGKKKLF